METGDRRVLYGKVIGLERELAEIYKTLERVEQWIVAIKKMLKVGE